MFRFQCPSCDKKLGSPNNLAGRLAVCPQCQCKFRVPQPELTESDDAAEERIAAASRPRPPAQPRKPRRPVEDEEDQALVKRPRRVVEDEDERENNPRRRIGDDEDDEEPDRPARKRKKKRKQRSSAFGGMDPLVLGAIGVAVVLLLLAVVSVFLPALAIVPIALGYVLLLVEGLWFLILAFQEDVTAGLLCLFVPFYSLYYLITNFDAVKTPFFEQVIGFVVLMAGVCGGAIGASR